MSDKKDEAAPKKKGGMMKWLIIGVGGMVLIGGGVAGGLYATNLVGGAKGVQASANEPRLIPKAEQKRGSGKEGEAASGRKEPLGQGGDKFASNYYAMDKEFTSNLQESVHFIQVGIAVSTPYDDRVIDNIKTNEIAVRSAILLALGDTTEEEVFTGDGKKRLQARLAKAINETLKQKEGFGGVSNVYFTNFVVQ